MTASQAQHYLVSTLLNSTNSYSTLLDFNTSAFNNSCIQTTQYALHSTHLAFNKSCIQHYLISTIMDSTILVLNNHVFNHSCFQHTLDSTIIVFIIYIYIYIIFSCPEQLYTSSCRSVRPSVLVRPL